MTRRRVLSPDEARVWRAVASTVTPMAGREETLPSEPAEQTLPLPPTPAAPAPRPMAKAAPPARRELAPLGHGTPPDVDRRSAQRMTRGEMAIDGRLDLHGMTQDSAHAALLAFISRAYDGGRRCVLVITGKGQREGSGVLRAMAPRWLNQSPLRERILGFSYARPHHGGEGALYVLIKRRRG